VKYLVTVGIAMDYGQYHSIEAPCIRKAYYLARNLGDKEKGEYAFEVHYDIPKWYHESLGCGCNQAIDDGWGDGTHMEEYLRPLPTDQQMDDLYKSMILTHRRQLEDYGIELQNKIVDAIEACDGIAGVKHLLLTGLSPSIIWENLVTLCDSTAKWNQGHGAGIVFDFMHHGAKPFQEITRRAYYKSEVWGLHPRCDKDCS
jgi:hypothetical protein